MRSLFAACSLLTVLGGCLMASGELSGRRAPGFALPDMSFQLHDLYDYRGRVVLLEIMQTSCPICKKVAPTLERIKAHFGGKVSVLSIVIPPDNQTTVGEYVSEFKITSPVLFDCGQVASSYMKASPQKPQIHVPHLFLIDRDGMIRNDFHYEEETQEIFERDGLIAEIDRLLAAPTRRPGKAKK